MINSFRPADDAQRKLALDPTRSFIVQAPAGSGKTELLTQRILALLARVERPEEVLAITFTRKAAAEMRTRLLAALHRAGNASPPESEHARTTWELARKALEHDRLKGWQLQHNPNRLQLVTIDSFCAYLVRRMPWMSRYGAPPAINSNPHEHYRKAAERLLESGVEGHLLRKQVHTLLQHLDNRLDLLRDMLVEMLARRDQWLRYLLEHRHEDGRKVLEESLAKFIQNYLKKLLLLFSEDLVEELVELLRFAGANLLDSQPESSLAQLADLTRLPSSEPTQLPVWLCIAEMLLTQSGDVRSRVTKAQGFPAGNDAHHKHMKQRMLSLLESLQGDVELVDALQEIRFLPSATYHDHHWIVLDALIELLPVAAAELEKVFKEQGRVDFVAVAGGASLALGETTSPEDLLLQLDSRITHILVDEFQDTSFVQFNLLQRLVNGWVPGDGRTLFLVGDPMQSIYRFREAEVGLFIRARQQGIENVELEPLTLTANFRSNADIVSWINDVFSQIFPVREDEGLGAVCYAPSEATNTQVSDDSVRLHLLNERNDHRESLFIVEQIRERLQKFPSQTHAILVRSRAHARQVVNDLRASGIRFQAQELEPLAQRQAILDAMALTRALLHPGDRMSWLAILRAPWCGLSLESLWILCEGDRHATVWSLIQEPQRLNWLLPDERSRLERLVEVIRQSLQRIGREPLDRVVYATWLNLGGPVAYDSSDAENVVQFLRLLEELQYSGDLTRFETLEESLSMLFSAADPEAGPEDVQVMTIHKAKGLEFDHVYLPGLGRTVRSIDRQLLRWVEHPAFGLLLAPVPSSAGQSEDKTYAAIGALLAGKDACEKIRLLYVACTRARMSLTLAGHVKEQGEELMPPPNSLLQIAWDALENHAAEALYPVESVHSESLPLNQELHRLPLSWKMPDLSTPSIDIAPLHRQASVRMEEMDLETARNRPQRIIGTVVHAWLEKLAAQGVSRWSQDELVAEHKRLGEDLTSRGYPDQHLRQGVDEVLKHLLTVISGQKGRWLLGEQSAAENEVALSGLVGHEFIDAVVDRTFIDEQGLRWVIDYKTSTPLKDEDNGQFVEREVIRYRQQVETYVSMYSLLEPERDVRGALYFTAIDHLEVL